MPPPTLTSIMTKRASLATDLDRLDKDVGRVEGKLRQQIAECNKLGKEAQETNKKMEAVAKDMYAKRKAGKEDEAAKLQKDLEKLKDAGLEKVRRHSLVRLDIKDQAELLEKHPTLCAAVVSQADKLLTDVKHVDEIPGKISQETIKIKAVKDDAARMNARLKKTEADATAAASKSVAT